MKGAATYHLFLGFHSFLVGLFPFFLPVYLIAAGYSISRICLFIAFTGCGFCASLAAWDRVCRRLPLLVTLACSFVAELLLLGLLVMGVESVPLLLLGLVNGLYNCLFWIIQRILFFASCTENDSGRRFGNFQIFVTVVLKAGIFVGGLLLESVGITAILILSLVSAFAAIILLGRNDWRQELPAALFHSEVLSPAKIFTFSDRHRSRLFFGLDGIYLYLESYFWLISLFYLVQQSFWELGIMVIVLAAVFSLLFYLLKNRIDRMPGQIMYLAGVMLYTLSWLLRVLVDTSMHPGILYSLLIVITFCTSFFRLNVNKRFFDFASGQGGYSYIFYKSYYSQFFLAVLFFVAALAVPASTGNMAQLQVCYMGAAVFAPLYAGYKLVRTDRVDDGRVRVEL